MVDTTFIVIGSVNYRLPPNPHGSNITEAGGVHFANSPACYVNSAYAVANRGYIEGHVYHNFESAPLHVVCMEFPSLHVAEVSDSDADGYYRFDNLNTSMQYMILAFSITAPDRSTTSTLKSPSPYLAT